MSKRMVSRILALALIGLAPALAPAPVSASAPAVGLSASAIDFGSVAWQHASAIQTLTVTNTGDAPLTIQTVDLAGEPYAPEDFLSPLEGCFSRTLAPGAQCQNQVYFHPESGGPRSSTMLLYDNAADSPQKIALTGTATGAVIRFTPRTIDFGTVPQGTTSAPRSFTIVNAGDTPATISRVALQSTRSDFAISSDACTGMTLGPGHRCDVSATVTPSSTGVTDGALVDVFDNAGTGEQTYDGSLVGLNVSGGGPHVGVYNGVPRPVTGVGTTAALFLQVFDDGTEPVQISGITLDTTTTGFAITHDACSGMTLPVGMPSTAPTTCELELSFSPPSSGSLSANVVFHDNGFGGAQSEALTGSGYAPAATTSTSAIDFGFQPSGVASAPQLVTLTNPSPQPLVVGNVTFGGASPGAFSLTSNSCGGATIASGASCSVSVAITPPFPYLFSATMTFNDNAANSPPIGQTVALRGEGTAPTFTISTSTLTFGHVKANTVSSPQSFTVTNTSSSAIVFGFIPGLGLNTPTGCSSPVQPGASCTVSVTLQSSSLGTQSALLKVFDPSLNQQVVEAGWNGTTGDPIIEGPLSFGSMVQVVGTSLSTTALIRNGGTASLGFGQLSLSNNPPAAITTDNCSHQAIAPGTNCSVTVTATPTTTGNWNTNLVVPTDTVLGPNPIDLFIRGLVGPTAQPVFFPASVAFQSHIVGGAEQSQVVWLDNGVTAVGGAQSLDVAAVAIGGVGASAFRVVWDGCTGLAIDSAYSCPVEIGFNPSTAGTFKASLLYTDDGIASPQAVALLGVGVAGAFASPQQVDFGGVTINTKSSPVTVTLTNGSLSPITVNRDTLSGANQGDYTITSEACQNQTLAPGASCQVVLTFRPQALGARVATLTFTDAAANSPQSVPLTGTGIGK